MLSSLCLHVELLFFIAKHLLVLLVSLPFLLMWILINLGVLIRRAVAAWRPGFRIDKISVFRSKFTSLTLSHLLKNIFKPTRLLIQYILRHSFISIVYNLISSFLQILCEHVVHLLKRHLKRLHLHNLVWLILLVDTK